jgi:predicted nucleotide-binding protein
MLYDGRTRIVVKSKSRAEIESVFSIFEEAPSTDITSLASKGDGANATIFIGHGRSVEWEKLKSHLQDKHDLEVLSYETGARAGHTIRDILDSMSEKSSMALLVLTGEDKTEEGLRARQNVIHECGLFQGRLGFDRAILIVEDGVQLASNFDGIQQLRFKRGRISEIFGDVIATIRREFGPI